MSQELTTPTKGIRSILTSEKMRDQFATALPIHLSADRFVRVSLTALSRTPKLMECTETSFFRCLLDLSALGLEPDGRNAHLIPYGKECTLIIDWKGLVALAKRSGDVASWSAETVCENDTFSWQDGVVSHEIDWRNDRGNLQCVYSRVTMKDGTKDFEVMTLAECEAIRKRSKAGNSGPWVSDFSEMCKKTVIRRHSKRLTLSPEFRDALEKDGDSRYDINERGIDAKVIRTHADLPPAFAGLKEPVTVEEPATETAEDGEGEWK